MRRMSRGYRNLIAGNADTIVATEWSRSSQTLFKTMGFEKYRFKEYNALDHSTNAQVRTIKLPIQPRNN